jgi:hypothetical protein
MQKVTGEQDADKACGRIVDTLRYAPGTLPNRCPGVIFLCPCALRGETGILP